MNPLIKNKFLFKRIHEFNFKPETYIHPSWFDEFIPMVLNIKCQSCERTNKKIARMLIEKIGNTYDYDFILSLKRIALLYYNELLELSEYVGLAIASKEIRQMIHKKQREKIKESFGKNKLKFVFERAQLLTQDTLHRDIIPKFYERPAFMVQKIGFNCILKQIKEYNGLILPRFRYKYPKGTQFDLNDMPTNDGSNFASSSYLLLKIIKNEMNPLWKTIFI